MKSKRLLTLLALAMLPVAAFCQTDRSNNQSERSMIKVAILYPNEEGKTFDMEYYKTNHMPMLAELYG